MANLYSLLRPILFKLDAEKAHHITLNILDYLPSKAFPSIPNKPLQAMGMNFKHPVGLAAGLDKNADHIAGLAKLGFSYIEIGTVTPKPQGGNPKPRLFRLVSDEAIINRMGFNNAGVDALVANVQKAQFQGILGINIGKNKDTALNKAVEDYVHCMRKVYTLASYITINISSPNTPDLRLLQQGNYFKEFLTALKLEQIKLKDKYRREVPLVVKISPDEDIETLKTIASIVLELRIEGIIATNTTCSRDNLIDNHPVESGGLSGKPLFDLSTKTLRILKQEVGDAVTLIGVGGIDNPQSAVKKIEAGADLIQLYTGLIYKGPDLIKNIVEFI